MTPTGLIAPSKVDNMEQGGLGVVKFQWLMPQPPKAKEDAIAIPRKAQKTFLNNTLVLKAAKSGD